MLPSNLRTNVRGFCLSLILIALLAAAIGCGKPPERDRNLHGEMKLHEAVRARDIEAVKTLLTDNAAPNVQDLDGVTPLHRAAREGDIEMATLLLEHHADPSMVTKDGWDAVHLAAWNEFPEMVKLLLQYGAVGNRKNPQGWTAIHMAAIKGYPDIIETCLLNWPSYAKTGKPLLDMPDANGDTPLLLAIRNSHPGVVNVLIMKGADVNLADKAGNTPLHLTVGLDEDAKPIAQQLVFQGADLSRRNADELTPYALAVEKHKTALAQYFWEKGGR